VCARVYGRRSDTLCMYMWVHRVEASARAIAHETLCARERGRERESACAHETRGEKEKRGRERVREERKRESALERESLGDRERQRSACKGEKD